MEQLHPGARWHFRIGGYLGAVFLMIFFGWFLVPLIFALTSIGGSSGVAMVGVVILVLFFVYIILVIALGEIYARLAYNNWRYEFTQDNLRLERGIIWKRYSNIPYERVQNVDINRGIIARACGFSSVHIQTAGYSGYSSRGGRVGAEGYIPAVDMQKAEQIREFVLKKIKGKKQGL